jgi:hypothetical protein
MSYSRQARVPDPPIKHLDLNDLDGAIKWMKEEMCIYSVYSNEKMGTGFRLSPWKLKLNFYTIMIGEAGMSVQARANAKPDDFKRRNISISVTNEKKLRKFIAEHRKRVIELMEENNYLLFPGDAKKKQPSLFTKTRALMESRCRAAAREAMTDADDADATAANYMAAWTAEFERLDKKWKFSRENTRLMRTQNAADVIAKMRAAAEADAAVDPSAYEEDDDEEEGDFTGPNDAQVYKNLFKSKTACHKYTKTDKKTEQETEEWAASFQVHPKDTTVLIYDSEPRTDDDGNWVVPDPTNPDDRAVMRRAVFNRFREYGLEKDKSDWGPPQNDLEGDGARGRPVQLCLTGGPGYLSDVAAGQRIRVCSIVLANKPDFEGGSTAQTVEQGAADMGWDISDIGTAQATDFNTSNSHNDADDTSAVGDGGSGGGSVADLPDGYTDTGPDTELPLTQDTLPAGGDDDGDDDDDGNDTGTGNDGDDGNDTGTGNDGNDTGTGNDGNDSGSSPKSKKRRPKHESADDSPDPAATKSRKHHHRTKRSKNAGGRRKRVRKEERAD